LPGRLRFEVRDTGIGIRADQLGTLSNRLSRSVRAAEESRGTGLGLAISLQLVRLMGGEIRVASRPAEGSGVLVRIDVLRSRLSRLCARPPA